MLAPEVHIARHRGFELLDVVVDVGRSEVQPGDGLRHDQRAAPERESRVGIERQAALGGAIESRPLADRQSGHGIEGGHDPGGEGIDLALRQLDEGFLPRGCVTDHLVDVEMERGAHEAELELEREWGLTHRQRRGQLDGDVELARRRRHGTDVPVDDAGGAVTGHPDQGVARGLAQSEQVVGDLAGTLEAACGVLIGPLGPHQVHE